jgi:hypothetical protein
MSKQLFADGFPDWWSIAKYFSDEQREVILHCLPKPQREKLRQDYHDGGWEDVFLRNELDERLALVQKEYGVDLLALRVLVLEGKSVFVKRAFWDSVFKDYFKGYADRHTFYIFGGYRAVAADGHPDEYKLVPLGGK